MHELRYRILLSCHVRSTVECCIDSYPHTALIRGNSCQYSILPPKWHGISFLIAPSPQSPFQIPWTNGGLCDVFEPSHGLMWPDIVYSHPITNYSHQRDRFVCTVLQFACEHAIQCPVRNLPHPTSLSVTEFAAHRLDDRL